MATFRAQEIMIPSGFKEREPRYNETVSRTGILAVPVRDKSDARHENGDISPPGDSDGERVRGTEAAL